MSSVPVSHRVDAVYVIVNLSTAQSLLYITYSRFLRRNIRLEHYCYCFGVSLKHQAFWKQLEPIYNHFEQQNVIPKVWIKENGDYGIAN